MAGVMIDMTSVQKEIVRTGAKKVRIRGAPEDVVKVIAGLKETWPEFLVGATIAVGEASDDGDTEEPDQDLAAADKAMDAMPPDEDIDATEEARSYSEPVK